MTKENTKKWLTYNNIAENKGGFLSIEIFQKEEERSQSAIDLLKKRRQETIHPVLRQYAFIACYNAAITRDDLAKKFNLSSTRDYGGELGQWLDSRTHTVQYRQKALDSLIQLCEEKQKTVSDRLRVQLMYNDSPDDNDPWHTPFILTASGGFFTSGWGDDPTDNILYRISDDTYRITAGANSITLKRDGNDILYSDDITSPDLFNGGQDVRKKRQEIFRLGPSPY